MARSNYSAGKRQREIEKAKRKKEKAARKRERSSGGGSGDTSSIPIATVDEIQGGLLTQEQVLENLRGGDAGDAGAGARAIPSRLFVGGLDWEVNGDQLRARFEEIGPVSDAIVVYDRDTGDSRGFGFVTMADRKDAAEAIRKLDGKEFDGRAMAVRQANDRK